MPAASLEQLRLLSNMETEKAKLMQLVLFGQPELDRNRLAEARCDSFASASVSATACAR
jgi:MSHA biogenesis protein MshM